MHRANTFLKTWIPRIMKSPAYRANGLIIITFDESGYGRGRRSLLR